MLAVVTRVQPGGLWCEWDYGQEGEFDPRCVVVGWLGCESTYWANVADALVGEGYPDGQTWQSSFTYVRQPSAPDEEYALCSLS